MNDEMTIGALEMRRAYQREWRKKNPDKVRKHNQTYWERKAKSQMEPKETKEG